MRSVVAGFASDGYFAVAPALFDRVKPGVELGDAQGKDVPVGRALVEQLAHEKTMLDVKAAVRMAAEMGKVAVVGYCWGVSLAYAAACEVGGIAAAVSYYGSDIVEMLDAQPKVPTIMHFGELDHLIPASDVEQIRAALPNVPVYTYPARHGFNRSEPDSHDRKSAKLARERTLAFLADHLGGAL
jgi:carboxymethylenebutenolidase